MMKTRHCVTVLLVLALACSACFALSACGNATAYSVAYHARGGTEITAQSYQSGEQIVPPENPTRHDFTFAGWYADESVSSPYVFGVMPARRIDLYAKWTPSQSVVLTFDARGGSAVEQISGYAGEEVSAPAEPERENYTFLGWYADEALTQAAAFPAVLPERNSTLYAKWSLEDNLAEVRFVANGRPFGTQIVEHGSALTMPEIGAEYAAGGWFTDSGQTAAYDFSSPVTGNMTLYASVSSKGLTVSGGIVTDYTGAARRVAVPEKWNGAAVTAIGAYAFLNAGLESVSLPEGLAAIGEGAFYQNEYLSEIALPKSVTSVGAYAFYGCVRLGKAELAGAATVSDGLFTGCVKLKDVVLAQEFAAIGDHAFADCTALKTVRIPETVTAIGAGAFSRSGLTSAYIPAGLTSIGEKAFSECGALADIIVNPKNRYYNESGNNLYSKDKSTLYRYFSAGKTETSFTIPAYTKHVAEGAFENNVNLKELTVPETVEVTCGMLRGMTALDTLTAASIGDGAGNAFLAYLFGAETPTGYGTDNRLLPESLKTVSVTGSVENVPDYAFYGLAHVEKFVLSGVKGLGNSAFAYSGIRSFEVPNAVLTEDLHHAFAHCRALAEYTVREDNPNYVAFDGCLYAKDGLTFVRAAEGKRYVEFSPETTTIAEAAFSFGCLETVTVPDFVQVIEKGAFYACPTLGDVTVPFLGRSRADGETAEEGYDPETSLDYFSYIFGATKTTSPGSNGSVLVSIDSKAFVPLTLNRVALSGRHRAVPDYAFYSVSVDTVVLPESVHTIGKQAFIFNDKQLAFDLTNITKVGDLAYAFNTAVKKVVVPGTVEELGMAAFAYQLNLEEVIVGEGVTELPQEAFSAYTEGSGANEIIGSNLTKISLPSTLRSIGMWAFYGAGQFAGKYSEVTVSLNAETSSLTEIAPYAFMYSGIKELHFPASLETVGASAFAGSNLLETITFGSAAGESRLKSVGAIAFYSLPKLTSVTVYKTVLAAEDVPALSFETGVPFYNDPSSPYIFFKIHIPAASVELFLADEGWANYAAVIEAIV